MALKLEPKKAPEPIRFAVFGGGYDVAAFGGWRDLIGCFPTIELAKDCNRGAIWKIGWGHIVELANGQIVAEWKQGKWVDAANVRQ